MASYVLTADVWYRRRDPDQPDQERYVKGDTIDDLTEREVNNLRRAGAVVEAKSDAGKRAAEGADARAEAIVNETPLPTLHQQSEYGTALANSGLVDPDTPPAELSEEQWQEELSVDETQAEAITAARAAGGADARVFAGERATAERPAKSATADEWRRWAVTSNKVSADKAETMNKTDLQALK